MSAGLIGNARTSNTTSPAPGAPTSGTSAQRRPSSGLPYRSSSTCFIRSSLSTRTVISSSARQLPAQPVAEGAAHDQLLVASAEPGQLLREHRHALPPRAGHTRDVSTPEHPIRSERLVELLDLVVDVAIRVGLARVARRAGGLQRDVLLLGVREHARQMGPARVRPSEVIDD